jgi:hypothetical protein
MAKLRVYTEQQTLQLAVEGRSLSRFGDGELRLCLGGRAASQEYNKDLAKELTRLLTKQTNSLVCLPWPRKGSPKVKNWTKICGSYEHLFGKKEYGSAFITRPDSAPWIENQEYIQLLQQLWVGKDVTLLVGERMTSLAPDMLVGAASVRTIIGPQSHAYPSINDLESQVGKTKGPVLMCMGATATCLAERLARKGIHAVDLGHVGWMVRRRQDWLKPVEAAA